jgi:HlyD family secretion protein
VNGRIIKIPVTEGKQIKQGDLLAEIDHEELDAQIAAARSNLDVAIANYDAAKTDLQRNKQLYQKDLIAKSQYDSFVTKADVTLAQVKQAQSNLALLQVQLSNVKIFAPISGVLSAKLVETGELVASGTALFTILDYNKPWVKIYLPLKEVERVTLNQKAYVKLDASGKKFYGWISFISDEAEFTPKDFLSKEERVKQVFAVKIVLNNKDELLKAGLPVDVTVEN